MNLIQFLNKNDKILLFLTSLFSKGFNVNGAIMNFTLVSANLVDILSCPLAFRC